MVFIEERHKFHASLSEQPKQMALFALLSKELCQNLNENIPETDAIYYACIQAIKNNSKVEFNKQYAKISRRKVSKDTAAPFVHDDFLIFILVIGVSKFESENEWLLGVVRNRAKNEITTTFENLLKSNYLSKANIQSLILVFLFQLDKSKITDDILNEAYDAIIKTQQTYNNDFIRIIHYQAFDIIIRLKQSRDTDEVSRLLEFESRFKKRINIFSYFAYNILLVLVLFGAYKLLHNLPEDWKSKINEIGILIGIGGVGLFANTIPKWRARFQELVLKAFGYK